VIIIDKNSAIFGFEGHFGRVREGEIKGMEVAREGRSEITGNKFTYKRYQVDSTSEVIMDRLQVALKEIPEI